MTQQHYDRQAASEIIANFDARPELLVQILHGLIDRFGWISEDAIRQLAEELNLSRADVHGVVSYYHDFRTTAPGRHIIKLCAAEACQALADIFDLAGLKDILRAIRARSIRVHEAETNSASPFARAASRSPTSVMSRSATSSTSALRPNWASGPRST